MKSVRSLSCCSPTPLDIPLICTVEARFPGAAAFQVSGRETQSHSQESQLACSWRWPRSYTYHFCSHSTALYLVLWSYLPEEEVEKLVSECKCAQEGENEFSGDSNEVCRERTMHLGDTANNPHLWGNLICHWRSFPSWSGMRYFSWPTKLSLPGKFNI